MVRMAARFAIALTTFLSQALCAQTTAPVVGTVDWSQFRGPGGMAVGESRDAPLTWGPDENVAWKTPLPGPGTSSPIVVGERIFLTCHTGYGLGEGQTGTMDDLQRHVLCLRLSDGEIVWSKTVRSLLPEQPYQARMLWHGYASSTPASDGKRVYVFFGKSGVFALDLDGDELWHASVGDEINGWGSAASPVLYKNFVIVNASVESQSLVALDKNTGQEVWRAAGIREAWNTPLLVNVPGGDTELVVGMVGRLLGLDPDTGEQRWSCDGMRWYIAPSAVAHEGVVYYTGGRDYQTMAVRAGGRGDVTASHVLWKADVGSNVSSPVYHDGRVYVAHDRLGIAYCLDAATGRVEYEQRLTPPSGEIYASPVLVDGKVFYLSRYGTTYVLGTGPEFDLLARNDLSPDRFFNASPALTGNRLLLRSDQFIYCIAQQ